jgi:hypothetical protein
MTDSKGKRKTCSRTVNGYEVLKRMRQWLQSTPWKISLNLPRLFEALEPSKELQEVFNALQSHVEKVNA